MSSSNRTAAKRRIDPNEVSTLLVEQLLQHFQLLGQPVMIIFPADLTLSNSHSISNEIEHPIFDLLGCVLDDAALFAPIVTALATGRLRVIDPEFLPKPTLN